MSNTAEDICEAYRVINQLMQDLATLTEHGAKADPKLIMFKLRLTHCDLRTLADAQDLSHCAPERKEWLRPDFAYVIDDAEWDKWAYPDSEDE